MIGVSQFPPTLNPSIDAVLAKSYVLGMARRPITARTAVDCERAALAILDRYRPAGGLRRQYAKRIKLAIQ